MPMYSRGHEREERDKMGRGLAHSVIGLILCWLPVIGLILSISGFVRLMVRLTEKYRTRLYAYLVVGVISLVLCVTVPIAEVYLYSRNPDLPEQLLLSTWKGLTGQDAPWAPTETPEEVDPDSILGVNELDVDPEGAEDDYPDDEYYADGEDFDPDNPSTEDPPPTTGDDLPDVSSMLSEHRDQIQNMNLEE